MKDKKGFTLIELLAVIVILGLLLAIAVPSVTKYITQSRKKTLTSTIGNYIGALVNEVNDLNYTFTGTNTIYAVPIECIALERGGTNPFGKWHQASNSYWAYVLVQYDDATSSYRYGYTFKDSAGYGLYPTTQAKLNENGKQIQTGLSLTKPTSGKVTNIAALDKWNGFAVNETTDLVVLEAESEGVAGNGETTCTLVQKGDNYTQVEQEKADAMEEPLYFGKPYDGDGFSYIFYEDGSLDVYNDCELSWSYSSGTYQYDGNQIIYVDDDEIDYIISKDKKSISDYEDEEYVYFLNRSSTWCIDEYTNLPMLKRANSSMAFWQYASKIKKITFQDSINIPSNISDEYKWDVSRSQNGKVMAYITPNASNPSYYDLYIQGDGHLYANPNSNALFSYFIYVDSINNIEILDTSHVTDMSSMFNSTGRNSTVFTLDLGDKFDTSNVTNMRQMFLWTGRSSTVFTLDLGDKFDTSNVTDMYMMFDETGYSSTVFALDLGDKFDTSNVTNMTAMFDYTGYSSPVFTLDLGDNFDTSNVTNMKSMFSSAGYSSTKFTLDLGDKFDTSKVTDMRNMFSSAGYKSPVFTLDCSSWNVDKVTNYSYFNTGVTSKVTPPKWVN